MTTSTIEPVELFTQNTLVSEEHARLLGVIPLLHNFVSFRKVVVDINALRHQLPMMVQFERAASRFVLRYDGTMERFITYKSDLWPPSFVQFLFLQRIC